MKEFEKVISPYTENLFPEFYKEEGPLFLAFVRAYYEWLESSNQAVFHARRLPDYRDIDKVIDDLFILFKKKKLPDIQFTTASNKQLFIKNALDFYRSKGTPRAVDLFFKLVHGLEARVYYPGDDLFRLSDNEFSEIQYLEVQESESLIQMVGQEIRGASTNAFAFVERLIRVKKETRYISVLILANVVGDFRTNEQVSTFNLSTNVTTKILGSLSRFEVIRSDAGFEIGERLYIADGDGKQGVALVSNTTNYVGVVDFELLGGGYGYTANAEVIGSDIVFTADNIIVDNTEYLYFNTNWERFETITQPLVKLTYTGATTNENFGVGTQITSYYGNNDIAWTGTVRAIEPTTSTTSANIIMTYDTTAYPSSEIQSLVYTDSNTDNGTVSSTLDVSATANVIASSSNVTIEYTFSGASALAKNDVIQQFATYATDSGGSYAFFVANAVVQEALFDETTGKYFADITYDTGVFRNSLEVQRTSDDNSFNLTNVSNTKFGVIDPQNTFYQGNGVGSNTGTQFEITRQGSFSTEATFDIVGLNEEVILADLRTNTPIAEIPDTTVIGTNIYGFQNNATAGFASVIGDAMDFEDITIGSIESILTRNPGRGYAEDPFFIVYEDRVFHFSNEEYDFIIQYEPPPGSSTGLNLTIGEALTGQTSGVRARITFHDRANFIIRATRLNPTGELVADEIFTSEETGFSATITDVNVDRRQPRMGLNANVSSEAFSGNGFITELKVLNSGYGYYDEEDLRLISFGTTDKDAQVTGFVEKQGVSEGYFKNRRGFLSSDKYLHDNDFYQEYSYKVLTSLPFESYKDTLIKVLHIAGTKPFGGYVATSEEKINILSSSDVAQFEIKANAILLNTQEFFAHEIVPIVAPELFDSSANTVFDTHTIRLQVLEQEFLFIDSDDLTYTHVISG